MSQLVQPAALPTKLPADTIYAAIMAGDQSQGQGSGHVRADAPASDYSIQEAPVADRQPPADSTGCVVQAHQVQWDHKGCEVQADVWCKQMCSASRCVVQADQVQWDHTGCEVQADVWCKQMCGASRCVVQAHQVQWDHTGCEVQANVQADVWRKQIRYNGTTQAVKCKQMCKQMCGASTSGTMGDYAETKARSNSVYWTNANVAFMPPVFVGVFSPVWVLCPHV